MKAHRISFSSSIMWSYKSPEPQQNHSCAWEALLRTCSDTNWCFTQTNCREQQDLLGPVPTSGEDEHRGDVEDTVQQKQENHEYNEQEKGRQAKGWTRTKDQMIQYRGTYPCGCSVDVGSLVSSDTSVHLHSIKDRRPLVYSITNRWPWEMCGSFRLQI